MNGRKKVKRRRSLLTVQCALCGVILLAVLLWRALGGESFDALRAVFREWLTDNALVSALSAWVTDA